MNKGRDFYRAQQAHFRALSKRKFYPRPLDQDGIAFALSDRAYKRVNVKNKAHTFVGADGKDHSIPYQTCTYIRIRPVRAHAGVTA